MSDEDLEWTVDAAEIAYTCPGFEVIHEEVTLPDGTAADFDYLSEPPSVIILPFTPEGDVVMIDEWREAVKRVNRGLPAGTEEPGDPDLAAVAARELREETGYAADRLEPIGAFEPANGLANTRFHYFVAYDCRREAPTDHDDDETIIVNTVPYADVWEAIVSGELADGRSALGLLYYHVLSERS